VVDIDLSKFFDRVHHQRLLSRLGRRIADSRIDLPPLNGTTSRERIWGWSKPREAINAARKEGTG